MDPNLGFVFLALASDDDKMMKDALWVTLRQHLFDFQHGVTLAFHSAESNEEVERIQKIGHETIVMIRAFNEFVYDYILPETHPEREAYNSINYEEFHEEIDQHAAVARYNLKKSKARDN